MPFNEEQLKERLNYITATDASAVLGLNRYKSAVDIWREKVGLQTPKDLSGNALVQAGIYLEEAVARWFSDLTEKDIESLSDDLVKHKKFDYIAAHSDRLIPSEESLLEVKTSRFGKGWGEQGTNKIPDMYLVQGAHEAMCFDMQFGYKIKRVYFCVLIAGHDLRWYYYDRNDELEKKMLAKYEEFWACVRSETPPAPQSGDDIISLFGHDSVDDDVIADGEIVHVYHDLVELKEKIKTLNNQQMFLENKIKVAMCNNERLRLPSGELAATWKAPKPSEYLDAKELQKVYPNIYDEFKKTRNATRRFNIRTPIDE